MPRVKKSEKKEEPVVIVDKKPDYGTGLTRVNNMLRAGFTMKEIAAEVGISPSTVSRHIKAARVKLSKLNYLL